MAHGAFRSRVGLLVRLPPHPRRLPLRLTLLRLPPRLLLRHWGQTTGTTTTPTTTICLTRRLNNLHRHLLAVPNITTATLDDVDIPSIDTTVVPTATHIQGPITRSRAKQLNYQVLSFLGT